MGLAIGFIVGKLLMIKSAGEEKTRLVAKAQVLQSEMEQLKSNQEVVLANEREYHAAEIQALKESNEKQVISLTESNEKQVQALKVAHEKQLEELRQQMANERQYAAQMREENNQQWAQKLEALRQEMQRMTAEQQKDAAEQLAAKQSALQENNRLQMDELLKPIKEQFADFKKSVEQSRTSNEVNKKELQTPSRLRCASSSKSSSKPWQT